MPWFLWVALGFCLGVPFGIFIFSLAAAAGDRSSRYGSKKR